MLAREEQLQLRVQQRHPLQIAWVGHQMAQYLQLAWQHHRTLEQHFQNRSVSISGVNRAHSLSSVLQWLQALTVAYAVWLEGEW